MHVPFTSDYVLDTRLIVLRTVHIVCVPLYAGLLWLHIVITCPPPPHVHSEMQPSVNSTRPDVTHRVVGNEFGKKTV